MFSINVRCHSERPRVELQDGARNFNFHPLAYRNGLRLLFRLVRSSVEGNFEARSAVVLEEFERSGFQSDPGNDPFAHYEAHTKVSQYFDLTEQLNPIKYMCVDYYNFNTNKSRVWIKSRSIT